MKPNPSLVLTPLLSTGMTAASHRSHSVTKLSCNILPSWSSTGPAPKTSASPEKGLLSHHLPPVSRGMSHHCNPLLSFSPNRKSLSAIYFPSLPNLFFLKHGFNTVHFLLKHFTALKVPRDKTSTVLTHDVLSDLCLPFTFQMSLLP